MKIHISYEKLAKIIFLFVCCFVAGAVARNFVEHGVQASSHLVAAEGNWGLGFTEDETPPSGNVSPEELKSFHAGFRNPVDDKVIYLTFDCGYENGNTAPILDALKKHNATGTFFVVGHFLESSPELIKRMVEEGHLVGNHTYHHPDMSQISTYETFKKELQDVEKLFTEITGEKMAPYYRPPQGKFNTENLKMASEMGYKTFFWSLAYVDWIQDRQPSREQAFEKLLHRVHPGAVVLLHSTSRTNALILDELLCKWEDMGYRFAPLSEFADTL